MLVLIGTNQENKEDQKPRNEKHNLQLKTLQKFGRKPTVSTVRMNDP